MWEDLEGAFLAVRENDLEALKSLFSRGRYSLLYRKNENGNTLLHLAALVAGREVSEFLASLFSSFWQSKEGGRGERVLRSLLNRSGLPPLHLAVRAGNLEFIGAFSQVRPVADLTDSFGNTVLHEAVRVKDPEVLKFVLERFGRFVNSVNEEGNAPLHLAVASEDLEAVKLLLKAGANKKLKNKHGLTPKGLAEFFGYDRLAEALK
jgi:ankyrin repeat protein